MLCTWDRSPDTGGRSRSRRPSSCRAGRLRAAPDLAIIALSSGRTTVLPAATLSRIALKRASALTSRLRASFNAVLRPLSWAIAWFSSRSSETMSNFLAESFHFLAFGREVLPQFLDRAAHLLQCFGGGLVVGVDGALPVGVHPRAENARQQFALATLGAQLDHVGAGHRLRAQHALQRVDRRDRAGRDRAGGGKPLHDIAEQPRPVSVCAALSRLGELSALSFRAVTWALDLQPGAALRGLELQARAAQVHGRTRKHVREARKTGDHEHRQEYPGPKAKCTAHDRVGKSALRALHPDQNRRGLDDAGLVGMAGLLVEPCDFSDVVAGFRIRRDAAIFLDRPLSRIIGRRPPAARRLRRTPAASAGRRARP